jgi:hypothetical protein
MASIIELHKGEITLDITGEVVFHDYQSQAVAIAVKS